MMRCFLLICFLLHGCSATQFVYQPCETNFDCRSSFGFDYTCDPQGFCQQTAGFSRCTTPVPAPAASDFIIGALFNASSEAPNVKAVDLAIEQVSSLGGIEGNSFVVVHCDYQQDSALDSLN